MREKICVSERRMKILELLRINRQMTRNDLANEFNVSLVTIWRDILFLSRIAPISTKPGNQGGIRMETEYKKYSLYLSDDEEQYLYSLMDEANKEEKDTIQRIIIKFSKNGTFKNQNTK